MQKRHTTSTDCKTQQPEPSGKQSNATAPTRNPSPRSRDNLTSETSAKPYRTRSSPQSTWTQGQPSPPTFSPTRETYATTQDQSQYVTPKMLQGWNSDTDQGRKVSETRHTVLGRHTETNQPTASGFGSGQPTLQHQETPAPSTGIDRESASAAAAEDNLGGHHKQDKRSEGKQECKELRV